MRYYGMSNVPGAPGAFVAGGPDLPFGAGGRYKTIQEQFKPGAPKDNIPIRVFPPSEPGREGAIPVRFEQAQRFGSSNLSNALPGAPGNMAGMINPQFYSFLPSNQAMMSVPPGFQNKFVS